MKPTYLSALLALLLLQGCQDAPAPTGEQALPYPVVSVPAKTVVGHTSYPASIEGTTNSDVRAKVSGYITHVLVDEGQKVRRGQTLFRLETQSLSQDAEAAQAAVNTAQVEVDKLAPLVEKNIVSAVQLESAKAQLAQAKSAYQSIVANIGYANIQSPIDGYVGSIPFREGALVGPADMQPLTTVTQTDRMYVFFAMNEKQYLNFLSTAEGTTREEKIKNFPKVSLELANGGLYGQEGVIETTSGQVNRATGTVSFRAVFPNPAGLLANGSSGRIRIPRIYEKALVIPESATYERQGKTYAYRVQGDSLAVNVQLDVLDRVEGLLVLNGGLAQGDKIVAQGVNKLSNNTPIIAQTIEFESVSEGITPAFK